MPATKITEVSTKDSCLTCTGLSILSTRVTMPATVRMRVCEPREHMRPHALIANVHAWSGLKQLYIVRHRVDRRCLCGFCR
eukprot:33182-Eustigmatos_ZCMA.PRE.1